MPLTEAGLFDYAVKALARRMRSERELRRLMATRAEPGPPGAEAIENVIRRLIELRYLSDEQFAANYTRIRKEGSRLGRRRVQQDLARKGISHELAGAALDAAYADTDETALAREFCTRKRIRRPEEPKAQARVLGRLMRAGFSSAAVFRLFREWGADVSEKVELGEYPDSAELPEHAETSGGPEVDDFYPE